MFSDQLGRSDPAMRPRQKRADVPGHPNWFQRRFQEWLKHTPKTFAWQEHFKVIY